MYRDDLMCGDTSYSVIVPDGVEGPYPVLLQLHGGGASDDHTTWQQHGEMELAASGSGFLVVMPRGYVSPGAPRAEQDAFDRFLAHDLREAVGCEFPVRDGPWAVGGISFGAYAALRLACRYPAQFASAWAHSVVYRLAKERPERSDLYLLLRENAGELRKRGVRIGLDCGCQDASGLRQSRELHEILSDLDVPHRYLVRLGEHNWTFWRGRVPDTIAWHVEALGLPDARVAPPVDGHVGLQAHVTPGTRTDVISLFDVDFLKDRVSSVDQRKLKQLATNTSLERLYSESFQWIFYGQRLPGFVRYCFPPTSGDPNDRGASLLLHPGYGIGVYTAWSTVRDGSDPLALKRCAWRRSGEMIRGFSRMGFKIKPTERHYPFIGVRLTGQRAPDYCEANPTTVGNLFTGAYEHEEESRLRSYVGQNISHRRYERLFIRWTEALGVYDDSVDEDTYARTLCRAVQIFETCIVIRALMNHLNDRVRREEGRLWLFWPAAWSLRNVTQTLRDIEARLIMAPPVQSVEGQRLLSAAYQNFGIDTLKDSVKRNSEVVDTRFQWIKTQLLVALGVVVFILDKFKLFEGIKNGVVAFFWPPT